MKWHIRSRQKPTGSLRGRLAKKKKHQKGRDYIATRIAAAKTKKIRVRGGGEKTIAFSHNLANIMLHGKAQKVGIKSVIENPADPHFVRRNIITKGAIIDTDIGKARVTSRPGRDGVVNAILVEKASAGGEKK
ncbi:MAG: 30S ribosomal protein S8e [Candidatus Aenigmarchaeota archaeon]|nr:30S ribosomal protein S8e [Candidatus Aenigmarchaeota archaeon]